MLRKTTNLTKEMINGAGKTYDIVANPDKSTNLFKDAAHAAMRAELETLIDQRADDMIPLQTQVGLA